MNALAIKLIIEFWHDECLEDPCDTDGWTMYSFSNRHGNFKHPEDFDGAEMQKLIMAGLAFPLAYYEHGQCLWTLANELPPGANCPWDSVGRAGYIIWESDPDDLGPKTVADRRADARAFVERFTQWSNGEVYGYTIEAVTPCPACGQVEDADEPDFDMPSCGGYYGDALEDMLSDMKDSIGDDWANYEVEFKERLGYGLADEARRRWKEEA